MRVVADEGGLGMRDRPKGMTGGAVRLGARRLLCARAPQCRLLAPVLAGLVAGAGAVRAEAGPCGAQGGEAVTVARVEAGLVLVLADGRRVLPAGVDPPRATPARPALADEARDRLGAWLAGRAARLRPLAAAPDRWERWPALVDADIVPVPDSAPAPVANAPLPVALALVDAGLGRARPDPGLGAACWAALVRAEAQARAAALGLWADPYYAVREAREPASLADAMGRMVLVRGRVTRISRGRSGVFVGLDGRDADFTLRFVGRKASIPGDLGLRADAVKGSLVRVRGTLDDRFGATIAVTSADQIEVLDDPGTGAGGTDAGPRR